MIINNFSMTKDQYDHICHLLISTPRDINKEKPRLVAVKYMFLNLIKGKTSTHVSYDSKFDIHNRVLTLRECNDIVKKIQSKLGYKS